jgi:hypothetical protein
MTTRITKLSRMMKMSWEIQRSRKSTRANALRAAWAIVSNEDISVWYLVQRYNRDKPVKQAISQMGLFPRNVVYND